jgi:hypothetical protein
MVMGRYVYVVFSMDNEDPIEICLKEMDAKFVVDREVEDGYDSWYIKWPVFERKDRGK